MAETTTINGLTNEHTNAEYSARVDEEGADLRDFFAILRLNFGKITMISMAIGAAMLAYLLTLPDRYLSTAIITPAVEEKQSPTLGALASFGISIGAPTKIEDLEALFKSNDLAVRVFERHDFWEVVFPENYDPKTKTMRLDWLTSLMRKDVGPKPPGEWHAIGAARSDLTVSASQKTGMFSISFESVSREGSAMIVRAFLEEAKNRLQEEALQRTGRNKKFIEEQIGKTVDLINRDRLYALYGQEVEREMMARNREQFGFQVIDSPRVPAIKSRPKRGKIAFAVVLLAFLVTTVILTWFRHHNWTRKVGVISDDIGKRDRS